WLPNRQPVGQRSLPVSPVPPVPPVLRVLAVPNTMILASLSPDFCHGDGEPVTMTPPRPSGFHAVAPQMSLIVARGITNRSRQLFRERRLTIEITATKWSRFLRRSLYSTFTRPRCKGSLASCLMAGAGPVGGVDGDAQWAWMQRPLLLG